MAIAMTLVCFAGFAPSYYLKGYFGNASSIKPLVHFHGLVFTGWMMLLIAQTQLVANGRVRLHRQLGVIGGALALLMIITGAGVAYFRGTTITPGLPHEFVLGFLAITVGVLLVFPALIGLALYLRQHPAAHKRLMLLATTAILPAAIQRLLMFLFGPEVSPLIFFGATDVFILAMAAYDIVSRGRIHPATLWGGLAIPLSQAGSLLLAGSSAWLTFAHWVTGT